MAHDSINGVVQSQHGDTLQAAPLDFNNNVTVTFTVVSQAISVNNRNLIRLATSSACFIAWGDVTISASAADVFFPAGVEVLVVPKVSPQVTHIAIVQQLIAGVASITPLGV